MRAYHIDRKRILQSNMDVTLHKDITNSHPQLNEILHREFPNGLSNHGNQYFASQATQHSAGGIVYEDIFEYERQIHFPDSPSRFQSFFGIKSESVKDWLIYFSNGDIKKIDDLWLWEIDTLDSKVEEHESAFLAGGDVNGLANFSPLVAKYYAQAYWSGEPNGIPYLSRKELLISPRIQVLRRVTPSYFL